MNPSQSMDCSRWGFHQNLEGVWMHRKGLMDFLTECVEEKERMGIVFFVISISRWNQIHIGSVPWNIEVLIVHWEDMCHDIIALKIGWKFGLVVDSRLIGKEVNQGITLKVEMWAFRFPSCGWRNCNLVFVGWENVHMCMCVYYCEYCIEMDL